MGEALNLRPYLIYLGLPVSKITISLDKYQVIRKCLKMMQKKYFYLEKIKIVYGLSSKVEREWGDSGKVDFLEILPYDMSGIQRFLNTWRRSYS